MQSGWKYGSAIEIQSVVNPNKIHDDIEAFHSLAKELGCDLSFKTNRKDGTGTITLKGNGIFLPVYRTPRTFPWQNLQGWKARKWFKEDFCAGPGNVLYVHPNGSIAPCCGFANENKALQITKKRLQISRQNHRQLHFLRFFVRQHQV